MTTQSHLTKVAIAGATGTMGRPIIDQLVQQGKHNVTALTRRSNKATVLHSSVEVAEVDYSSQASLTTALKGQDILIICLSIGAPAGTESRLIDAAGEAGVQWVLPNLWSVDMTTNAQMRKDLPFAAGTLAVQSHIVSLGMSWVSVCCSFWYEHSLASPQCFAFDLGKKRVTFFDDGNTAVTASTWEQCGRAVAALLALPVDAPDGPHLKQWKNKNLYCSSFYVSQRDMLDSVLRVTGGSESEWTIEHESSQVRFARGQKMLQEGNMLGGPTVVYGRVFYPDGSGDFRNESENAQLGLPEESLDEATKKALKMFDDGYEYNPFAAESEDVIVAKFSSS